MTAPRNSDVPAHQYDGRGNVTVEFVPNEVGKLLRRPASSGATRAAAGPGRVRGAVSSRGPDSPAMIGMFCDILNLR